MTLIPPPLQHTPNLPLPPNEPPDSYWRSLYYFNGYRFIVALLLLSIVAIFGNSLAFGSMIFELFVYVSAGYVMFSTLCFLLIASRRRFQLQLGLQVSADPEVPFDRSHLNQVMWNLCRNALRHCRRQDASIRIAVDVIGNAGNIVKLDVVDDVPGVPPVLRNQLFEPFFTTVSSGTGLGLYIAREVCEVNGATLEYVETPAGTQFTILCQGA